MITKSIASVLIVSSVCVAQAPIESSFLDQVSVNEHFSLVNYKGSTESLVQFIQGVNIKLSDTITASIDIPVYFQGTTDFGAIEVGFIWDAYKNETISLGLNVGIDTPMNNQFGAASFDPNLGGVLTYNLPWGNMKFEQTLNYEFVVNSAYSLPFGSKVSDDIISADSSIFYLVNDTVEFGATVWQNYTVVSDGQQNILVGPNMKWDITPNVNLSGSVSIPVYQNVTAEEQNYVLSAGLGIKF